LQKEKESDEKKPGSPLIRSNNLDLNLQIEPTQEVWKRRKTSETRYNSLPAT
jgi:hypothetical protein